MKADRTPDTLRAAAALLEEYQALGTPDRLRESRRSEAELTIENHALRQKLDEQKEIIANLNRRLDAIQTNTRAKEETP